MFKSIIPVVLFFMVSMSGVATADQATKLTQFSDVKEIGSTMTLTAEFVTGKKRGLCHRKFHGIEDKTVCINVRKLSAKYGQTFFFNATLLDASGNHLAWVPLLVPEEKSVVVTYDREKKHLLFVCEWESCNIQRYESGTSTVGFEDSFAIIHVTENGRNLIASSKNVDGECSVASADPPNKRPDESLDWDFFKKAQQTFLLKHGEKASLGSVEIECYQQANITNLFLE